MIHGEREPEKYTQLEKETHPSKVSFFRVLWFWVDAFLFPKMGYVSILEGIFLRSIYFDNVQKMLK